MTYHYPVPFYGTIKLIDAFQEKAGIATHREAVDALLMVNRALISDAQTGLRYKVFPTSNGAFPPAELYEGNLDSLRQRPRGQRDIMVELRNVDPVHVTELMNFLEQNEIPVRSVSEALTVAIMVAKNMYDHYGTDKTGEMHIPAVYPHRADDDSQRHIYLKLS